MYVSSQVHSRTFAIVLSRVLFVVCSNYQWDICLTSRLVLPSQQLPFNPNVVQNVLKGEVLVVLINGKSRLLQDNAMD